MSTLQRFLCILAVPCSALSMMAQTGLHFVPFSFDSYTGRGTNCMAFGLDRDVNAHGSISFEVQYGFRLFDMNEASYQQSYYQGWSVDYTQSSKFVGFQYRSSYLFEDGSGPTPYLSVLVGVRSAKLELSDINVYGVYYNDPVPNWARENTETIMVFPVGLRFGYRSPLDGYTGDVYFGIAQQFGKDPWSAPYLDKKDQLAGFTFHVGYAFGIGWD